MESFLNEAPGDAMEALLNNYKFDYYGKYNEVSKNCLSRDYKVFQLVLKQGRYGDIKNKPIYIPKGVTPKDADEVMSFHYQYSEENPDVEATADDCPPSSSKKDRHGLRDDGSEKYKLATAAFGEDNPLSPKELAGEPMTPEELAKTGEKPEPYVFGSEFEKGEASGGGSSVEYYSVTQGDANTGLEKIKKHNPELASVIKFSIRRFDNFSDIYSAGGKINIYDVPGNYATLGKMFVKSAEVAIKDGFSQDIQAIKDIASLMSTPLKGDYSQAAYEKIQSEIFDQTDAIRGATSLGEVGGSVESSGMETLKALLTLDQKKLMQQSRAAERKLMDFRGFPSQGRVQARGKFVFHVVRHEVKYEKSEAESIFSADIEHPMDKVGRDYAKALGGIGEIKLSKTFSLEPKLVIATNSVLTITLPGKVGAFIKGKPDITSGDMADFINSLDMLDTVGFIIVYGPKGESLQESFSKASLLRRRYRRRY